MLHQLTKDGLYKARFDLQQLSSGTWYWAEYSKFIVDSEATKYQLTIGGYSGEAGDALTTHSGMKFTTLDSDNDVAGTNCAVERGGGFWWKKCGPAHITASQDGDKSFEWKRLLGSKDLQTSRGWLMCP